MRNVKYYYINLGQNVGSAIKSIFLLQRVWFVAHNCKSSPRGFTFFGPLRAPDTHEVHTHMVKQSTHKHEIIK